jgi:putative FmdB family regulatory protein
MPNYGFICDNCDHRFDCYLTMDNRNNPLKESCPECKKAGGVIKDLNGIRCSLNSDATLTPDKATGGKWSELMTQMKRGVSKRYHTNLDQASSQTGRLWKG